jgi:hypothetical protein
LTHQISASKRSLKKHGSQPEIKSRIKKFSFIPKGNSKTKVYGLPETQYDIDSVQDLRIQFTIVLNEVTWLLEKLKLLKTNAIGGIKFGLSKCTLEARRNFNRRWETMCGMTVMVAKVILMEFGNNPGKVGIEDMSYLLNQKQVVTNEIDACHDNFEVLKKASDFLEDSREVYTIISNSGDRKSAKPSEVLRLLGLIKRARYYWSEISEKIRLMKKNTLINRKDLKLKKIKVKRRSIDTEKLSNPDSPNKHSQKKTDSSQLSPNNRFPTINGAQNLGSGEESGLSRFSKLHSNPTKKQPEKEILIFQSRVYYNPYLQDLSNSSPSKPKIT